ncbi:MAG: transcription-repair coupling factor [Candidatus Omnitrophica bacterium]|nr:transcription-repair coupling factor [Candidatus Omnitrophota bacterium]
MFKTLKIYLNQEIAKGALLDEFSKFGYSHQAKIQEEGDFSHRGSIIDIFPFTFEYPLRIELDIDKIASIKSFDVQSQRMLWDHQMVIILAFRRKSYFSLGSLTNARGDSVYIASGGEEVPVDNFLDLSFDDYVVHTYYGIGKFVGIKKLEHEGKLKDHLAIRYSRGDMLYVPMADIHLVSRYVAFEGARPKLSNLGSGDWQKIKERTKKAVKFIALDLLNLQAARSTLSGFRFSQDTDWQREFEASFSFTETPDQRKALDDVKKDMESDRPMDRLLCGDVGYGKTEVAMRAAFKAVMDNKQVAILVPTTILATQHYYNFSKRHSYFPINVAMISRFNTKKENLEIIESVKKGKIDILIGTHRMLSSDIDFKDLGLIIIDEEQRFGVRAKEKLKRIRLLADILTLTATPIPRTLYMSLTGLKDISAINTPPKMRLAVKTAVAEYDERIITQAITREVKRGGQIYFVHNRIEDIQKLYLRLKSILKEKVRLGVAHGRMASRDLEQVTLLFLKHKIDCLISTTIIESGIDIPNANTLILDNAENFGLSDLHQLRGRVGRFNRQAYAYFLVSGVTDLNEDAKKRLKAIEEYSQLGSGFRIALEDLEIRGAGNLLGKEQHGYIMAVGFDLYARLLRSAVSRLYGQEENRKKLSISHV